MKLQLARQRQLNLSLIFTVESNLLLDFSVLKDLLMLETHHLIYLEEWFVTPIINLTRYWNLLQY